MDLIDYWWISSQQSAIRELRESLTASNTSNRTTLARQNELLRAVLEENDELRLRVGVLIRLLVQQGVVSREQFSTAVNEAKANLALAQKPKLPRPSAKLRQKLQTPTAPKVP